jgi:ABC-2 type transport system permease protein
VPTERERLELVARRELRTVVRARGYLLFAVVAAAVALGVARVGGTSGYVPTVLDLLAPVELLVAAGGVVLGYGVFVADRRSGEASVRSTFPVATRTVVLGTFLGRGVALAAGVALVLAPPMVLVWSEGGGSGLAASHSGADSALLYLRFVALATLFGLSVLSVALAASALAGRTRSGVVLAAGLWIAVAVGADLALIAGLGDDFLGGDALVYLLAATPTGAFRGLILETVVDAATSATLAAAATGPSLVGLAAWVVAPLGVATWALHRS